MNGGGEGGCLTINQRVIATHTRSSSLSYFLAFFIVFYDERQCKLSFVETRHTFIINSYIHNWLYKGTLNYHHYSFL